MTILRCLFILCLTLSCFLTTAEEDGETLPFPSAQLAALNDLYISTKGYQWNWRQIEGGGSIWNFSLPDANPCFDQWQGINCTIGTTEYVVSTLRLYNYGLEGALPTTIGNLQNLSELILDNNALTGTVPDSVFSLSHLQILDLSSNRLHGTLSNSLGNLVNLRSLVFDYNLLSGSIPESIGSLSHLQELFLSYNNISSSLPTNFFSLETLHTLQISNNRISGRLTDQWRDLSSLSFLGAYNNLFHGSLSENLFPAMLTSLDFSNNSLTGTLPVSLGSTPLLNMLRLSYNQLHGTIPSTFMSSLTGLQDCNIDFNFFHCSQTDCASHLFDGNPLLKGLGISHNSFSGEMPSIPTIIDFGMRNNYFSKEIPSVYANSKTLFAFDLSNNFLSGHVTLKGSNFGMLNLSFNHFSGGLFNIYPSPANYTDSGVWAIAVNNNQFTGTLPEWGKFVNIGVIVAGNNELTGTLPKHFNRPLSFFGASTNCFHGTIPLGFCTDRPSTSELKYLILNGLSSASSCQLPILPGTAFKSFTLERSVSSEIPSCLFRLPKLKKLHLSGNGLSGSISFPEIGDELMPALSELILSHNFLTGSIPSVFQEKNNWGKLDLSYNQFRGNFLQSISNFSSPNQQLILINNHLSGEIPTSLLQAENIDILEGNLFYCNYQKRDLPSNDPNVMNYSCGTDLANLAIYTYLVVAGAIVISILLVFLLTKYCVNYYYFHLVANFFNNFKLYFEFFHSFCEFERQKAKFLQSDYSSFGLKPPVGNGNASEADFTKQVLLFWVFNQRIRQYSILLTCFIFIILLPSYAGVSKFYSIYENVYAWTISALFLSGKISGIVIAVELFAFLLFSFGILTLLWAQRSPLSDQKRDDELNSDTNEINNRTIKRKLTRFDYSVFVSIALVNFTVMILSDFLYAYIVIHYDTLIITTAEFFLALFKLYWNNIVLWNQIITFHNRFHSLFQRVTSMGFETESWKEFSPSQVNFLSLTINLNNLVYPILAIVIISSNCFYNILFPTEPVSSSFQTTISTEVSTSHVDASSSYDPPFIYSYQCSSVIYSYYIPVYTVMFVFDSLIFPWLKLMKLYYQEIQKSKENEEDEEALLENRRKGADLPSTLTRIELTDTSEMESQKVIMDKSLMENLLVENNIEQGGKQQNRHRVLPEPHFDKSAKRKPPPRKYKNLLHKRFFKTFFHLPTAILMARNRHLFDKNHYLIRCNSTLLILVAYGAFFPPLAMIACFAIILRSFYEEVLIGRYLYKQSLSDSSSNINGGNGERKADLDCSGMLESIRHSLRNIIVVSIVLYAYLIFDIFGKETAWYYSLLPGYVFVVSFLGMFFILPCVLKRRNEKSKNIYTRVTEDDNALE
jgi:hypothetical protein